MLYKYNAIHVFHYTKKMENKKGLVFIWHSYLDPLRRLYGAAVIPTIKFIKRSFLSLNVMVVMVVAPYSGRKGFDYLTLGLFK